MNSVGNERQSEKGLHKALFFSVSGQFFVLSWSTSTTSHFFIIEPMTPKVCTLLLYIVLQGFAETGEFYYALINHINADFLKFTCFFVRAVIFLQYNNKASYDGDHTCV